MSEKFSENQSLNSSSSEDTSSSAVSFIQKPLEPIKEEGSNLHEQFEILKGPLLKIVGALKTVGSRVDDIKIDIDDIKIDIDLINRRLSRLLGNDRKNDISKKIEDSGLKFMMRKYPNINFESNKILKFGGKEEEEIDMYGETEEKIVIGECTFTVMDAEKVIKFNKKKNRIAESKNVHKDDITAHIFCFRIDKDEEKAIMNQIQKYDIVLIHLLDECEDLEKTRTDCAFR